MVKNLEGNQSQDQQTNDEKQLLKKCLIGDGQNSYTDSL